MKATRSGRVGVLATSGTVASGAYERAIQGENAGVRVFAQAAPLFVPLAVAIGAPGGGEGDYLGAERYVARDAFKATIRRKARQAPDAALDAVFDAWAKGSGCAARSQCIGSLESWRRNDGSWDLGAADRDILLGKGVVLGGFVGLAVIDFVALSALVFFARTILFAES